MMLMFLMIMFMMMLMFLVIMLVVMLMLSMAAALFLIIMMMFMLFGLLKQHLRKDVGLLHRAKDLCSGQLVPRGRNNCGIRILFTNHCGCSELLFLRKLLCTAQYNGRSALNLVVVKFAKILHIHFNLCGVCYGRQGVQLKPGFLCSILYCLTNIRELANA